MVCEEDHQQLCSLIKGNSHRLEELENTISRLVCPGHGEAQISHHFNGPACRLAVSPSYCVRGFARAHTQLVSVHFNDEWLKSTVRRIEDAFIALSEGVVCKKPQVHGSWQARNSAKSSTTKMKTIRHACLWKLRKFIRGRSPSPICFSKRSHDGPRTGIGAMSLVETQESRWKQPKMRSG